MEGKIEVEAGYDAEGIAYIQGTHTAVSSLSVTCCQEVEYWQKYTNVLKHLIRSVDKELKEVNKTTIYLTKETINAEANLVWKQIEMESLTRKLENIAGTSEKLHKLESNLIAQHEAVYASMPLITFDEDEEPNVFPINELAVLHEEEDPDNGKENEIPEAEASSGPEHKEDLTKLPLFFCECGVQFSTKQNCREHVKYYTLGMNFRCPKCGLQKYGLNQLRNHMKTSHGINVPKSLKGCRACGETFSNMSTLQQHRRRMHQTPRPRWISEGVEEST